MIHTKRVCLDWATGVNLATPTTWLAARSRVITTEDSDETNKILLMHGLRKTENVEAQIAILNDKPML